MRLYALTELHDPER